MLRTIDLVAVAIFGLVVTGVLVLFVVEVALLVRERRGRSEPPTTPGRRLRRRAVLAAGLVGIGCIGWGYVEPRWPEVDRVRITSPRLPPGDRPLRIVHLSDIHSDPVARLEPRLPGLIAPLAPDLILYTGDSVNERAGRPHFRRLMTELAAIAPMYAVRGNWDLGSSAGVDLFDGTGAVELNADSVVVEAAGRRVRLAGCAYAWEAPVVRALRDVEPDDFTIFLFHTPDLADLLADARVDLALAGHTHGGQVALPFYGAIITLSRFGKRFEGGLYRVEDLFLHVSRGIGMEGGPAPRVRFCARPEITLIELDRGPRAGSKGAIE